MSRHGRSLLAYGLEDSELAGFLLLLPLIMKSENGFYMTRASRNTWSISSFLGIGSVTISCRFRKDNGDRAETDQRRRRLAAGREPWGFGGEFPECRIRAECLGPIRSSGVLFVMSQKNKCAINK
jgi:hypothetical protein